MRVAMLRTVAVLFLLLACTTAAQAQDTPEQAQDSLTRAVSSRGDEVLVERNPKT